MTSRPRAAVAVLSAALALAAVSSCSGDPDEPHFADLRAEPGPQDTVTSSLLESDLGLVDPDTVRWVGEHRGTQLWLGFRERSPRAVCLLTSSEEKGGAVFCGSDRGELVVGPGDYVVVPDGYPAPEGKVRLSSNVYAS